MKLTYHLRLPCLLILLLFIIIEMGCGSVAPAIDSSGPANETVVQAISNDNWIFTADQALPLRGRSRILPTDYDVICKKDTLVVYLPYYGRAYSAPIGQTRGPLDFTSTAFTIEKERTDKGSWFVTIKPTDNSDVQSLFFTFYDNGAAQLQAQFINRDAMSFLGKVSGGK